MSGRARTPAMERFMRYVRRTRGCWYWLGGTAPKGYGRFRDGESRLVCAPRWIYQQIFGPIPPTLQIDHKCNVPGCVRPDHLDDVTNLENQRRKAARRTHCPHGHPWS